MRNRAVRGRLVAIVLAIVPATGVHSKNVRGHPPQNLPEQQTNPSEKEKPPNPDKRGTLELPLVVRSLAPEKTQQEAEDDARERNDKRWNDRAALVIGLGTLLILIVQAIAFFVQAIRLQQTIEAMKKIGADQSKDMQGWIEVATKSADAAQRSADIAKSALIVTQGASVSVDNYRSTNVVIDNVYKGVAFNIVWKNSGITRANKFINFIQAKIFDQAALEIFDFKKLPEGTPTMGFINGGSGVTSGNFFVNKSDLELAKNSERALYIWGGAIYNDMFDGTPEHHTYVCVRVKIVRELFGPTDPFAYEAYKYEAD